MSNKNNFNNDMENSSRNCSKQNNSQNNNYEYRKSCGVLSTEDVYKRQALWYPSTLPNPKSKATSMTLQSSSRSRRADRDSL